MLSTSNQTEIKAASLNHLIQLTVDSFDDTGNLVCGNEIPHVMFFMHRWFMSSEDLANSLIHLYKNCDSTVICSVPSCTHFPSKQNCPIQRAKASICYSLRYWIENYPMQFDIDPNLRTAISRFRNLFEIEGNTRLLKIVDLSKVPSYDWMRNMSVRVTNRKPNHQVSLVFDKIDAGELAEQLTYLEYKAFRRISFLDYKNYTLQANLKDTPKLERSICLFNGLSQWIQCMVLSKTTPQERSNVMKKFINVAKRLHDLHNFNSLMAVVGGLSHSSLARLSKTNTCLSSDAQKVLLEYMELLSSNNNFNNYRRLLQTCQGFKIPILGVHLKDLISLHNALPDKIDNENVNFGKMVQMSSILETLTSLQKEPIPVEPNIELINTIKLSLDMQYSEDEIYELSLACEPRNSLTSPTLPIRNAVFADWVAGISLPDPAIINKHVNDMVEAVFKVYDHNKDGFISHREFDDVAGNFPFIDSFCVLDADKDGMISKEEMKTYFVRANCHALKGSFKHDFHETTYFRPTFCIHCTGLLWGIIKQGWKCKDCGTNVHKHCKDLVVVECRVKTKQRGDSIGNGSEGEGGGLTYTAKRKMSQRQRLKSNRTTHQATQTDEDSTTPHDPSSSTSHVETAIIKDRLSVSEESRRELAMANSQLHNQLLESDDTIRAIWSSASQVRQKTLNYILQYMDSLHIERDTKL